MAAEPLLLYWWPLPSAVDLAIGGGFRRAVVPKGSGVSCPELAIQEASGIAEALVAALGVNPADD